MLRTEKKSKVVEVAITAVAAMFPLGIILYAISHFELREVWPELVLYMLYMACLVMMWMYFFNRLNSQRFNFWCSMCVGATVLLRDILFAPPLAYNLLHQACITLAVLLLIMLTIVYMRKELKGNTKYYLWTICIIDVLIAAFYNYDIYLEPIGENTNYLLAEIWIRPAITCGLVACYMMEIVAKNK